MYSAISANKRNTLLIMALFVGVIGAVGWVVGYLYGNMTIAYGVFLVAAVYALIQYFMADKLAIMSTGAVEIQKNDNPRLWRIVENLAITEGLPMPRVYILPDSAPNAFATGRDPKHAVVAATSGILDIMDDRELSAVFAHEMSHVKNYDIRVSMIAFGLVSVIGMLSDIALRMMFFRDNDNRGGQQNPIVMIIGIIFILLAPVAALLIQMAISRQREYLADASGVELTRDPEGLADALEKLEQYGKPMQKQSTATSHLFISNPLKSGGLANLFSTHPPLEDRIKRLRTKLTGL
jgi:heat shock protein HtpX